MIRVFSFLVCLSLLLVLVTSVSANHNDEHLQPQIPERSGDYADPEHPGLRVRVFVHDVNNVKGPHTPADTTSSSLVCSTDPDSNAFVSGSLHLPATTWTYKLNTSSVPSSVGSSNLSNIAGVGFSQWTNEIASSASKPTLFYDGTTDISRNAFDGTHVIAWGRTSGTALGVTYLWYYPSTGEIAETDTIMNKKFQWAWSGGAMCAVSSAYDAQNILTHEIGHWFGMDDEYAASYVDNTMYGYGFKGEAKKDTLTTGDKVGVSAIYH